MTRGTTIGARLCARLAAVAALIVLLVATASAQVPGGCTTPASERTGDIGCYLSMTKELGVLPPAPVFWHVYNFPSRFLASAGAGPLGVVVEAFDKVWLFAVAEKEWRPSGGERVAVIGPLEVKAGRSYTARYMEAAFMPGMRTSVHRHSGPEAWYLVSGSQCLETPDGAIVAKAGDSAVVPEGPPMVLSSVGRETRRSVLLVLHESNQPWVSPAGDWQPKGACPK